MNSNSNYCSVDAHAQGSVTLQKDDVTPDFKIQLNSNEAGGSPMSEVSSESLTSCIEDTKQGSATPENCYEEKEITNLKVRIVCDSLPKETSVSRDWDSDSSPEERFMKFRSISTPQMQAELTEITAGKFEATQNLQQQVPKVARYFLMHCASWENISRSQELGFWATSEDTEDKLNIAFQDACSIILITCVPNCTQFTGFARLSSLSQKRDLEWDPLDGLKIAHKGVFKVEWMNRKTLDFAATKHLYKGLDSSKPISSCSDGQELEPGVGRRLCDLLMMDPVVKYPTNIEKCNMADMKYGNFPGKQPQTDLRLRISPRPLDLRNELNYRLKSRHRFDSRVDYRAEEMHYRNYNMHYEHYDERPGYYDQQPVSRWLMHQEPNLPPFPNAPYYQEEHSTYIDNLARYQYNRGRPSLLLPQFSKEHLDFKAYEEIHHVRPQKNLEEFQCRKKYLHHQQHKESHDKYDREGRSYERTRRSSDRKYHSEYSHDRNDRRCRRSHHGYRPSSKGDSKERCGSYRDRSEKGRESRYQSVTSDQNYKKKKSDEKFFLQIAKKYGEKRLNYMNYKDKESSSRGTRSNFKSCNSSPESFSNSPLINSSKPKQNDKARKRVHDSDIRQHQAYKRNRTDASTSKSNPNQDRQSNDVEKWKCDVYGKDSILLHDKKAKENKTTSQSHCTDESRVSPDPGKKAMTGNFKATDDKQKGKTGNVKHNNLKQPTFTYTKQIQVRISE